MSVQKPLPHDAARLHVTGAARYVDDIPLPANCLHLAFGQASIAAGEIAALDVSTVARAAGVAGVWTAQDLPGPCDCSPSNHDEPLLSDGTIHYLGQPVFMVAASSHLRARKAARLAQTQYEARTPILTVDEALAQGSYFDGGPRVWLRGDVEGALHAAEHHLSGQIEMGGQEHFYLEGQAALAVPQENGDMLIHASTQHPTEIQHKVADALGLPMHAVRVETRRMGGGFGGKESQGNALAIACAVVAAQTGRPAKMRYDRDDDFMITGKRHDFRISYEVGFDARGQLQAVRFKQYTRCGWAQDLSLPVADRAMLHADNAYFLPFVEIESHRLRTNTQSATAFRGFGGPQGMLGIERVMDHIAHHLGRDGADVRAVNYYASMGPAADVSISAKKKPQARNMTPYGQEVTDFVLHEMTDALKTSCDYEARQAAVSEWNAGQPILRKGLALSPVKFGISFTLTHLNQAGALVHVYQDGSVVMNHGGTEMGQGLFQKVAQVAAEQLQVPVEAVRITATDTSKVPNTSATAASSGSDLNGMAVRNACAALVERMRGALAEKLGVGPEDVRHQGGVFSVGDGQRFTFAEVAQIAYVQRVSLSATGFYKTPKLAWDRDAGQGRPFFYFAYGVAATEVVIDTLTGENRILRADVLHDCGRSLNPALDVGQIEGGYVQGAGWLTTEELVWDDSGRLRTHAPSTYKIPTCSDRPDVFNIALWNGENREDTVYRSKAVGEPPFMLGISAHLALSAAVAACGPSYPDLQAPATPEEVLQAVERARHGV